MAESNTWLADRSSNPSIVVSTRVNLRKIVQLHRVKAALKEYAGMLVTIISPSLVRVSPMMGHSQTVNQ